MTDHAHHHHGSKPDFAREGRAFAFGIALNLLFVAFEFIAGLYSNSLSLMADAGHNLGDVAALALALLAVKLSKRKSTTRFTYGFQKSTVLVSLVNALILYGMVGGIGWEALQRLRQPANSEGGTMMMVAGIGVLINAGSALLFRTHQATDLNARGAYLHLLSDALVSLGVLFTGLLIHTTEVTWIDPLVSLLIMLVIVLSTWKLLRESWRLAIDAVPAAIDPEQIRTEMLKVPGVNAVYHLHIWAMATTTTALTAHMVLRSDLSHQEVVALKNELRHRLEHLGIQHCTFETEYAGQSEITCSN